MDAKKTRENNTSHRKSNSSPLKIIAKNSSNPSPRIVSGEKLLPKPLQSQVQYIQTRQAVALKGRHKAHACHHYNTVNKNRHHGPPRHMNPITE